MPPEAREIKRDDVKNRDHDSDAVMERVARLSPTNEMASFITFNLWRIESTLNSSPR
jgi:hypothetical protein